MARRKLMFVCIAMGVAGAVMATIESFVPILDLGGTFVFAISGAVAAVNRRLDIFGIPRPVLRDGKSWRDYT